MGDKWIRKCYVLQEFRFRFLEVHYESGKKDSIESNKHRDFDTKSRCSFYVQKSQNTSIFKAFYLSCSPRQRLILPGLFYFTVVKWKI